APVKGQISNQNETVHVEFTGQEAWEYDLKKVTLNRKPHMRLTLPALDESTIQKLSNFKSPFVKSLRVEKRDGGQKNIVYFELSDDSVESFDYLTDQPSRLIVDFFVGSATVAKSKKPAVKKPVKVARKKSKDRVPASSDVLI